ncbi:MAG: hypothetical protein H7X79_11075 [Sporomusaceae bacterium]|nr:hypothetical protein [Sporomusaceae bacterium]
MVSNIAAVSILFICIVVFAFYKREMLVKMFSIDVTSSANHFQQQLEQTADIVIKRLEEQIIHLEYLLVEANEKIASLDEKIQAANKILCKESNANSRVPDIMAEEPKTMISHATPKIAANEIANFNADNDKEITRHDKRNAIIEMADLGYDITEIAKATAISQGEIILLLQLNKK